jgi:hypothetical protein
LLDDSSFDDRSSCICGTINLFASGCRGPSPTGFGDSLALLSGRTRLTTSGRGILEGLDVKNGTPT